MGVAELAPLMAGGVVRWRMGAVGLELLLTVAMAGVFLLGAAGLASLELSLATVEAFLLGAAGLERWSVATVGGAVLFFGAVGLRSKLAAGCGRAGGFGGIPCGLCSSRRMSICRLGSSV